MHYTVSATSDIGTNKTVNQDAVYVKIFPSDWGEVVLGVVCDGMGGHDEGEVASASVVAAFENWASNTLTVLLQGRIGDGVIREQWSTLIETQNALLREYGMNRTITLGTTVTALLITEERWFCVHVGDSRAYEITADLKQLTRDHTLVASEVALGNMTPEQAELSPKRNVLLQCIGIAEQVSPEFYFGTTIVGGVYVLCSDGFRHVLSGEEIREAFQGEALQDHTTLARREKALVEEIKARGETDNISVVSIVTRS